MTLVRFIFHYFNLLQNCCYHTYTDSMKLCGMTACSCPV